MSNQRIASLILLAAQACAPSEALKPDDHLGGKADTSSHTTAPASVRIIRDGAFAPDGLRPVEVAYEFVVTRNPDDLAHKGLPPVRTRQCEEAGLCGLLKVQYDIKGNHEVSIKVPKRRDWADLLRFQVTFINGVNFQTQMPAQYADVGQLVRSDGVLWGDLWQVATTGEIRKLDPRNRGKGYDCYGYERWNVYETDDGFYKHKLSPAVGSLVTSQFGFAAASSNEFCGGVSDPEECQLQGPPDENRPEQTGITMYNSSGDPEVAEGVFEPDYQDRYSMVPIHVWVPAEIVVTTMFGEDGEDEEVAAVPAKLLYRWSYVAQNDSCTHTHSGGGATSLGWQYQATNFPDLYRLP